MNPNIPSEGWGFLFWDCSLMLVAGEKILGLIIMTLTAAGMVIAGDPPDSAKTYSLREVLITADRASLTRTIEPSRVYQLSRYDLERANGGTLGEVMAGAPGTFVQEYGPGGGLQTLSLRGMDAEHTLILLNGIPINNVQTGQSDLRMIPLAEVDEVEIARGGASAAYGTNPLGGIVSIKTSTPSGGTSLHTAAGAGSFGTSEINADVRFNPSSATPCRAGFSEETGRENYPFQYEKGGTDARAERANSDYRSRNLFISGTWQPDSSIGSDLFLTYGDMDRGTPGPFLTPENQGLAREEDRQIFLTGSIHFAGSGGFNAVIAGSFQNAYEHYVNAVSPFSADNYYQNESLNLSPSFEYRLNPSFCFSAGGEIGSSTAAGNAIASDQRRNDAALFLAPQVILASVVADWSVSFYPSIRLDSYSGSVPSWSPRCGMSVNIPLPGIQALLHAVAGNSFRVPTFNELYYNGSGGIGNLSLKPEHAFSAEGGITLTTQWIGHQEIDVTYYAINTSDRIFWLPTAIASVYSPQNIGETVSSGWEGEFHSRLLHDRLEFGGTYSWLDAHRKNSGSSLQPSFDNQLPYVPLDMGGVYCGFHIPLENQYVTGIFGKLSDTYIGVRYITEDNAASLPSYHVINANLGMEFVLDALQLRLKYELDNIANANYEAVSGYPMPLQNQSIRCDVIKNL